MGKESDKQRADEPNQDDGEPTPRTSGGGGGGSKLMSALKLVAASAVLLQAVSTYHGATAERASAIPDEVSSAEQQEHRRRLQSSGGSPSYMEPLFDELKERRKLMEETPPEEVKYWFEYTGPLQVRCFPRWMLICEIYGFVYKFIFDSRTS